MKLFQTLKLSSIVLACVWGVLLVTLPPIIPIALIGALLFPWLVARRPEFAILLILFLTSSIIYINDLPKVPLGVGSLHLMDIMILYMLGQIIYQALVSKEYPLIKTPLHAPLLCFYGAAILSIGTAVFLNHVSINDSIREFRRLNGYLLIIVLTQLIKDRKQCVIIIKGMVGIALLVSMLMLVQAIVGDSFHFVSGRVEEIKTLDVVARGVHRILPPGQTLIYIILTTLLIQEFMESGGLPNWKRRGCILLLGIGCVLTYNRNYYVALGLALTFLMMLTGTRKRVRVLSWGVTVILGFMILFPLSGIFGSRAHHYIASVSFRFKSLFSVEELINSKSMEWRWKENRYAMQKIKKNPFLGVGIGNKYRPPIFGPHDRRMKYIHNAYLYLWVKMGVFALLSFIWLCWRFVARGIAKYQEMSDSYLKGIILGNVLGFTGIMAAALVNPFFMQWFSITVFGVMFGLSEVIYRLDKKGPDTHVPIN